MTAGRTAPLQTPDVSVIVPTYNRASVLANCLDALLRQSLPSDRFEIMVSDDGSSDDTPRVAGGYADMSERNNGPQIRYICQPNSGANAARNRAFENTSGRIVLLINDDTIAAPAMLEEHFSIHVRQPATHIAVLGRVTAAPELPHGRLAALHLDRAYNAIGDRRELDWRWFFTCNVSAKRALIEAGGLFEEKMRYHEDLELSERLSRLGLRVIYNPAALGYHYHVLSDRELLDIAKREADALIVWAAKSPHLIPMLGEFGFEPALSPWARRKNLLRSWIVNDSTMALWAKAARLCPAIFEKLALSIYLQMYQSAKRTHLLKRLNPAENRCPA